MFLHGKRFVEKHFHGNSVAMPAVQPGPAPAVGQMFRRRNFKGDQGQAHRVYTGTEPLMPEDIAEIVVWVASVPGRVNIKRGGDVGVSGVGSLAVHRTEAG